MDLNHIIIFIGIVSILSWAIPQQKRGLAVFVSSILAIYWLQPALPIRHLDFWLPTLAIGLVVLVWAITQKQQLPPPQQLRKDIVVLLAVIIGLALTRYVRPLCCLTATRPPQVLNVVLAAGIVSAGAAMAARRQRGGAWQIAAAAGSILLAFIILKSSPLSEALSRWLRTLSGQNASLAASADIRWIGFSYIAFRLLHTLRDHQLGRLPPLSLSEFVNYVLFFPTLVAGPIDRVQHFVKTLRNPANDKTKNTIDGGTRIIIGLFKKFVIADSLAIFALNPQNAPQIQGTLWLWVVLYAYALRIYFDFSGYTDIAIGLAGIMGYSIPENFKKPYLKQNLTLFWNSWHITLAQWFRAYFFNPLTRSLRQKIKLPQVWQVIFIAQAGTMVLIGLWHGVTINFALWGLWHGIGLFIHNRWIAFLRMRFPRIATKGEKYLLARFAGIGLTFNYVALGWLWFALPTPQMAWLTMRHLFGFK